MKLTKTLSLLTLALLAAASAAQARKGKEKGHDIKIKVTGFKKDSTAKIGYYYGRNRFVAQDTAKADKNGLMEFKGSKTLPGGVYICLMPKGYFEFLVADNNQDFTLETDTADIEMHMKVKGSKENSYFYEYRRYTSQAGRKADSINRILTKRKDKDSVKMLKERMRTVDKEVDSFRKVFIDKYPGTFAVKVLTSMKEPKIPETPTLPNGKKDSTFAYRYYKSHYWDNMDLKDERIVRTPFYEEKLDFFFKNEVLPSPDSIIVDADKIIDKTMASNEEVYKYTLSWILNHYEDSQYMGMDAVSSHIVEKYYLTKRAPWVDDKTIEKMRQRDSIVAHLLIGKVAPELYLTDSAGKLITLSSIMAQNHKYVILYFWDATCSHCQHATPILHDFYEKNKGKIDLVIYAATIERKTKDWTKYIKDNKIGDWINVWDSYTVTDFNKMYDVYSTPVLYILDSNRKIIAKRIDTSQLQDYFDHLEKQQKDEILHNQKAGD